MKTLVASILFILGACVASAQVSFTPQSPSGTYYEVKTQKVMTLSGIRGDSVRRDTNIYTFKTPMYGVWKNDTAVAILGIHKASQDSLTYVVKYRVIDPQGTYLSSSWTSAISATLNLASIYYYRYTPGTVWTEWQVTVYRIGTAGNVGATSSGTLTAYTVEFKQR